MERSAFQQRFGANNLLILGLGVLACCVAFVGPAAADDSATTPPAAAGATPSTGAISTALETESTGEVVGAQAIDPTVLIAAHKRCSSRTVVITPSYSGGRLVSSTVFVNGFKIQTITAEAQVFKLGARRFKRGKNSYEVVSIFSSGKSASQLGSFKRCKK